MKPKLSGFQRMQFTKEWIKRGKPPTREGFVKRCCEAMNIEYTPPPYAQTVQVYESGSERVLQANRVIGQRKITCEGVEDSGSTPPARPKRGVHATPTTHCQSHTLE
jgi:hypothetical protein